MATPDAWTFSGTTVTGAGVTYNYTTEFNLISDALVALTGAVENLTAALTGPGTGVMPLQLAAFNAAFSPTAGATPGTVAHKIGGFTGHLKTSASSLVALEKTANVQATSTVAGADQISATLNSVMSTSNALQQIFIAQQNKKAEFEKAATQSALKRSGLPEVEVPQTDINTAIEQSVTDAGTIALQANVNGFVQTQISSGAAFVVTETTQFIKNTTTYQEAAAKLDAIATSIGDALSSVTGSTLDAEKTAGDTRDITANPAT